MLTAYFYVTGLVAIAVEDVISLTNKATTLYVTFSVTNEAENVSGSTGKSAAVYVTVGIASTVKYVIAFPNGNESEIFFNGVIGEIPGSSVKECPTKEYVAVLRGSCGCFDVVTLADDDGLYHISAGGVELYGQSILSFSACRKSKYRQSNTQCKYCDFGGESNIFHTSS